jgi:hypothetical protein
MGPKIFEHEKAQQNSILQYLFRFLEWREGFLNLIFCSYDDLPSLTPKMLLHHRKSISEGNYHQRRRSREFLWQIGNGSDHRPALEPAQFALYRHEGEGGLKIIGHATPPVI